MCALCIPDGPAKLVSRSETQHSDTCLPAIRSQLSTFDSQLLSIHTLTNFASLTPLESALTRPSCKSIKTRDFNSIRSHSYEPLCKSMKTRDFNPFRIRSYSTPLRNLLIQKHLTKHGGRGEGGTPLFALPFRIILARSLEPAVSETRCPRHTSNSIGKRVPRKRGWL